MVNLQHFLLGAVAVLALVGALGTPALGADTGGAHGKVDPKAPAIIAVNKNTGKLVWEDNSVNDKILHGQWSTPAVG